MQVDEPLLTLDFPARPPAPSAIPPIILEAFPEAPVEGWKARDYMLVYENETIVRQMKPRRAVLDQINLNPGGVIITAPGDDVDFVSRFFTPQASIFEDPVTGSAHCSLIPYWSHRLGKPTQTARQLSARGGRLWCRAAGDRVFIAAQAVTYLEWYLTI